MAIQWEEVGVLGQPANTMLIGVGAFKNEYTVWRGGAYISPDERVVRWIAKGWPEPDSDRLPLFDSCEEAMALCEAWETIKAQAIAQAVASKGKRVSWSRLPTATREEALERAREAFSGTRAVGWMDRAVI